MRAPLSWLREFTPLDAPVAAIADALNHLGLEVEEIDEPGREIAGVVVARVLDVVPHPNADKLRLCDVDFGDGHTRVVCGAPNVVPGMVAPFAPAGATLPGGFTLERRKIRGVVSDGMLCSAAELGLGDDHSGILDLDTTLELGTDVRAALGLDDVVFDLAITPNRSDAMSIVGIARDLAAHFSRPFTVPVPPAAPVVESVAGATVEVEAPDRCPRFVARVARVTTGPSPEWLARRLRLAGMRPISNVVDVTNYVMLERGRPLHAFDFDRLPGRGVVVRLAAEGETIVTLDGVERRLRADDLLVCDAERRPQGIAGIMGGTEAEVSHTTTSILLESAYFEASGIARTSKRLGLRSEASARFERGVDPNGTASGADRAIDLLVEVAAAEPEPGAIDRYPRPIERPRITVRTARVNALLGTAIDADRARALLEPLGIDCEGDGNDFVAIAPTFRPDLEREIDIVEEVARRIGLDAIPRSVPANAAKVGRLTTAQQERRLVADVLVGAGYDEAFTLSLVAPADLERAGVATDRVVEVENPLRADESVLRPAILPGLLRAVATNAAHGEPDVALFELGHVFAPPNGATLPDERDHLAAVRSGSLRRRPHEADRPVVPADALDALDALAGALRLADLRIEAAPGPGFHPGRAARVLVDGVEVGHVGEVAPDVRRALAIDEPVVAFELDVAALLAGRRRDRAYRPVSRYPASTVDLAFVLDDATPAAAVRATLADAAGDLLEDVRVFDVFRSDALGAGKVSIAFALRFRAPDRTLTDEEVGALRQRGIDAVVAAHGAQLRG
ncbi:MAG TPA: phenylalanine--tRNA ligase subunit beta [Acidimicrobiia bacterium]|nr:phenylalanine--tRNA ligase subunit beta [Acidimicrobiia bacterium]